MNPNDYYTEEERLRKREAYRREMRRRKKRRSLIAKIVILVVLVAALIVAILAVTGKLTKKKVKDSTPAASTSSDITPGGGTAAEGDSTDPSQGQDGTQTVPTDQRSVTIAQAAKMAEQYDYQGAIDLLNTIEGADKDADIITLVADYETQKSTLVATQPEKVTHVFFHSLVVDPARGFSLTGDTAWDNASIGFSQWMTTVDEFNAILQQMYDRGYVLVAMDDLMDKTVDDQGVTHIAAKPVYLPQGKTPFVLSLDDLSYYHSYNGRGIANKMVIGEDGTPTCEYIQADGSVVYGSYDCVPLLDDFVDAHPDFSYKGAKGTIALTGYNGILGYRTDYPYADRNSPDLDPDQAAWLDANPSFNYEQECAQAKAVADCIKADGWTFASHTWGHIRIYDYSMESLKTDTEKWLAYVAPLIGGSDTIIFAHGQDLAAWNEDYASTEKFQYLKGLGFNVFCNVDSAQYFVQYGDLYFRMGRRNLDGLRMYQAMYMGNDKVSDLFDVTQVFDSKRPTDAYMYGF